MLTQPLATTFTRLAAEMRIARDDWWVFGSAAMALFGLEPDRVKDIDVIVSTADARRLMKAHALDNLADGGTPVFRSEIVLHPDFGEVPVEVLANFQTLTQGRWTRVRPRSRVAFPFETGPIYTPSRADLAAVFLACGRPGDLERAAILQAAG